MALRTDPVAARRREFGGVHHLGLAFDVQGTGPVAALAADTVLAESRIAVAIERALAPADLAGVAEEAGWLDRPAPAGCGVGRIPGRDVPGPGLRVPRDRRLEEESVAEVGKAAAGNAGSDVVAELALISPSRPWTSGPGRRRRCHSGLGKRRGGMIPEPAAGRLRPLLMRHGRDTIAPADCLVAWGTCLIPDKQGRDGEEQHHRRAASNPAVHSSRGHHVLYGFAGSIGKRRIRLRTRNDCSKWAKSNTLSNLRV